MFVELAIGRASVFLSQPPSYSVNLTETANVTCSANRYNVSYQWIIESGLFPSKVIGINNNTLVIPNITSSDENTYTCMVTTEQGCVSSNTTQLIVTGMIIRYIMYKLNLHSCVQAFRW